MTSADAACRCDSKNDPLWAFCEDDLYCPQCGLRIAELHCNHWHPATQRVWVYPREVSPFPIPQFTLPLELHYRDRDRNLQKRPPSIDVEHSMGPQDYFDTRVEPLPHGRGRVFYVRLVPTDEKVLPHLPRQGLRRKLTLVSDAGKTTLPLMICNTPEVSVALKGRGIEPVGDNRWEITVADLLTVELSLQVTAPLIVSEDLAEIDVGDPDDAELAAPAVAVRMSSPLRAETVIYPSEPWSTTVHLDTRRFTQPGQRCQLIVLLQAKFTRLPPIILQLERVEKGRIRFDDNPYVVEETMYIGEVRSNNRNENPEDSSHPRYRPIVKKLYAKNEGNDAITLSPLEIDGNAAWLRAHWDADDIEERSRLPQADGKMILEPGERAEIYLRIDLTGVEVVDDSVLSARLFTTDERSRRWDVPLTLNHIRHRTPCPYPLAVDFGNSNSYVAIQRPGPEFRWSADDQIVPAHALRDPERYPTALFFESLENPECPEYVIGPDALRLGRAAPRALVKDLKRWIGVEGSHRYRSVYDRHGRDHRYDVDTLIGLYIARLIEEAERIIRCYRITRVGVAYPSNFGPGRREAFQRVLQQICESSVNSRDRKLVALEADIDEANAGALSFVLDKVERNRLLRAEQLSFVVASFDLGGGSMDTALLRFRVTEGNVRFPIFCSEYLGIGGLASFGGDNVTIAVMELLKKRLLESIGLQGVPAEQALARIPMPIQSGHRPGEEQECYEALWDAAEEIKIYQSLQLESGPDPAAATRLKNILVADLRKLLETTPAAAGSHLEALQAAIEENKFLINLEDIYRHVIAADPIGEGGYSVEERVRQGADELFEFARQKCTQIDFVVLGGSASRLPLVKQVFMTNLGKQTGIEDVEDRIIFDPRRTKFRVAYGLARYLSLRASKHCFAASKNYTSTTLGLWVEGDFDFIPVVPNCSPVDNRATWYKFEADGYTVPIRHYLDDRRHLRLYRRDLSKEVMLHGWFDLSKPGSGSGDAVIAALTEDLPSDAIAAVRLVGSEFDVELTICAGGQAFGYWHLVRDTMHNQDF